MTIEPCMVQAKRLSCDVSLQTTENSSLIVTDDLVEYASIIAICVNTVSDAYHTTE